MDGLFLLLAFVAALLGVLVVLLSMRGLRQRWITAPIFKIYRRLLPSMSETERDALEAGTVWWEGELFAGRPDWHKLLAYPRPRLTPAEQNFLDTEVEELCRLSPATGKPPTSITICRRRPGPISRPRASSA